METLLYVTVSGQLQGVYREYFQDNSQCWYKSGLILGLRPANERRRYKVTLSLIGWAQILGLHPADERRHYKVMLSLIGWAQT